MSSRSGLGALLVCALVAGVSPAAAQRAEPGWIGISFEIRSGGAAAGRQGLVVVTSVQPGSPAEAAGVAVGDRILAINGLEGARELADLPDRLRLRAGDLVRLRFERDGRRGELRMRAAGLPDRMERVTFLRLPDRTDSMVETMFRAMDSLRWQLQAARWPGAREPAARAPRSATRELSPRRESVSAPFEYFVFRGEQHDSLRREMEVLEQRMRALSRLEQDRLDELAAVGSALAVDADAELAAVRTALEEVSRRSAALHAAMSDAARATAGLDYALPRDRPDATVVPAFRPLTPYLLGSNRVAGAEVVELRPELAQYFAVERGVLIVDVAPGTPAAIAGMRPGDVVIRLDRAAVRTIDDLRQGVSQAGDSLPVTLVRQGAGVEVLLRRR